MKPNLRTNLGRFLLGAVLLLAAGTVWAQPQNIRGKITDPAGQPVAGASVIVKGTTNGTSAKADGTFELGAAKGATLQITMLGYKTAEKEVTTATFYPITLEDDSKLVDEVVVVGYGAVKKSDLTGSVASVKMGALDNLSSTSVDGLLQGRAAGLQVLNTSQDPGAGAIVRIRGNSSLEGSNTPLVVVNGFPMGDAGNLSQINVSDIESIEILKDASASAIYGSRGANGVILVTTKSAAKGQTNISVKHQTVISQLSDPLDIWYDPMLMAQVTNEEQVNAGLNPIYIGQTIGGIYYPSLLEIQNGEWANTNWRDLCLRTPVLNSTTAAISSANDRASINLNVNYHNNQGLYKKDSYERINANLGVTNNLYKNLKLTSYNVFSITNRNISNGLEYGRNPLWPVYDKEGNYYLAGAQDFGHPLVILDNVLNKTTGRDFVTSLAVDWELVKGLTIHSQLDYRYQTSVGDVYRASNTAQDANDNGGIAQINNSFNQNLMSETYLTFSRTFNENHALTVMAGHSYNWDTGRGLYTTARGFVNDVLQNENMNAGNPNLRQIYNDGVLPEQAALLLRAHQLLAQGQIPADGHHARRRLDEVRQKQQVGLLPFGGRQLEDAQRAVAQAIALAERTEAAPELRSLRQSGHQQLPDPRPLRHGEILAQRRVGDRDRPRLRGGPHRRQQPVYGMGRHRQSGPEVGVDLAARFRRRFRSLRPSPAADRRRLLQKDHRPAA